MLLLNETQLHVTSAVSALDWIKSSPHCLQWQSALDASGGDVSIMQEGCL